MIAPAPIRLKPRSKPETAGKGTPDVFVRPERDFGLEPEAEKWLAQHHGVKPRDVDLYLHLIGPMKLVYWSAWSSHVEELRQSYREAGWKENDAKSRDSEKWQFRAVVDGIDVGVRFGTTLQLYEVRREDPNFRAAISETGFRSTHHVDKIPAPQTLLKEVRQIIAEGLAKKKPRAKPKLPPIPAHIAEEIHRTVCPKGRAEAETQDPRPKTSNGFDQATMAKLKRSAQPTTALVPTTIDVLTSPERKALARAEGEIDRSRKKSLEGFVAMGTQLRTIRDGRLYRASHATFEAYCLARWGIKKTSAYELMDGAAAFELARPIAEKLRIEFTAPAQLRPLAGLEAADLKAVLQRAAKTTDGVTKQPTMETIAAARSRQMLPAEDRERAKRKAEEASQQRAERAAIARLETGNYTTPPNVDRADQLAEEAKATATEREAAEIEQFQREVEDRMQGGEEPVAETPLLAALTNRPFFPKCETIGQACCYLRSWIGAMLRQFRDDAEVEELASELHHQWMQLESRKIISEPKRRAK